MWGVCGGVMGVYRCAQMCQAVCGCVPGYAQVYSGCVRVCAVVLRCRWMCVRWCAWAGVRGYVHVWDDFSEFLPETRVLTSVDFNTYPIRILYF